MSSDLSRRSSLSFRQVLAFAFSRWRRHKALLASVVAGVLAWTVCDVMVPVFAGRLVDALALPDRAEGRRAAVWAVGGMTGLGLGVVAGRHWTFLAITRFTLRIMTGAARDAFARVQRMSTDWHANNFAGATVRKVSRGMWALDTLDDNLLLALLPSLLVLAGSTVVLGLRWPAMGALVAAGSACYVALAATGSLRYVAPAARLSNRLDTAVGALLADAVTGNAVVKSFGAETREDARLASLLDKWSRRTRRFWVRGTNNGSVQATVLLFLRIGVVGAGVALWWEDRATPGDVAWVLTTYLVVHGYLRDVGQQVAVLQRAVNELHDMAALDGEAPGVLDRPGARPFRAGPGEIVLRDVRFGYGPARDPGAPLFDGLSLRVAPGERIGLVGPSGSGKTTLVKLMQRLYDVDAGRVLIDGHDVRDVTQESLRAGIALVPQDPALFHRSLAENIAYGRPDATRGEIERAARLANAHDFISRLPRGYATPVGERGIKLSGGERQRVALARAFLADAPVLILDEATSSLDSESEALIQDAMLRLMRGRTAVVIAHRLSTVRALDRILVFDRGRVVEDGSHEALMGRNGTYRRLFTTQASGLAETV